MKKYILKVYNRTKNKIYFKWKKEIITPTSKGIYLIALYSLYHEENEIICDLESGDIIIHVPELNYHVIVTGRDIIVTNHDFPNLGQAGDEVVKRFRSKAKTHISKLRQHTKNEILANNRNLIQEVQTKIRNSSRLATLKMKSNEHTNNKK